MDFHEIEAFTALAETLHFARAAARIHLSPSALSRLLGRLEDELSVTLFERDTRSVELTTEGEAFLVFARDMLHRRDELRLCIGNNDGRLRGILRVYASVTACYSILPPFVEALSLAHPGLRLSVETGDPAEAADAVREGKVELALGALPVGGFRDLECFSVRKTPLVLVTSAAGPYASLDLPRVHSARLPSASREQELESILASVPLILPKNGLARERIDRWVRDRGIKPRITAETAGNEALLAFARLGFGLALVPKIVLENSPFADGLVQYDAGPEFGDYDIGFVQKPSETGNEAGKKLRIAVMDIIQRTYPS